MKLSLPGLLLLSASVVLITSCGEDAEQNAPSANPGPEVTVVKAHEEPVPLTKELVGRLAAPGSLRCVHG